MSKMKFPPVTPCDGDATSAARAIEAGLYAEHLLEQTGSQDSELIRVVELGHEGAMRLWAVGLRLAMQQASILAMARALPLEELFQDACLTLGEAIYRFDYKRGVQFSTYAHKSIRLRLLESNPRLGTGSLTRRERQAAAATRAAIERLRLGSWAIEAGAAAAGVSAAAAARGFTSLVPLEADLTADPSAQDPFRAAEASVEFLELLLPAHRRVLKLRFGLTRADGEGLTLAQCAIALGVSLSTAARWERSALAEARRVLSADRTMAVA